MKILDAAISESESSEEEEEEEEEEIMSVLILSLNNSCLLRIIPECITSVLRYFGPIPCVVSYQILDVVSPLNYTSDTHKIVKKLVYRHLL